jgi:hypothetical protein
MDVHGCKIAIIHQISNGRMTIPEPATANTSLHATEGVSQLMIMANITKN